MLKTAVASLSGVLPIQANTGKDADVSSHSDYLARTHGQALCPEIAAGPEFLASRVQRTGQLYAVPDAGEGQGDDE